MTAGVGVTDHSGHVDAAADPGGHFNVSTTSVAVIDREAFQPTMRRENTSVMNATYTTPDHVEQYVKSATHFSFGRVAVKSRCTRSGARTAVCRSGW